MKSPQVAGTKSGKAAAAAIERRVQAELSAAEENRKRLQMLQSQKSGGSPSPARGSGKGMGPGSPAGGKGSPARGYKSPAPESPAKRGGSFMDSWKSKTSTVGRDDYGTYHDGRRTRDPNQSRWMKQLPGAAAKPRYGTEAPDMQSKWA